MKINSKTSDEAEVKVFERRIRDHFDRDSREERNITSLASKESLLLHYVGTSKGQRDYCKANAELASPFQRVQNRFY
jgi:hypothetical protein